MKRIVTLIVSLSLGCWLSACDGSSRPALPTDIALSDSGVVWADGSLQTEITALVLDSGGETMENIQISLTHDGQYLDVDPSSASTGENGTAVFSVGTQNSGPVTFQAVLDGQDLGDSLEVDFTLQLGLDAGEAELIYPGGLVALTASVSDADGPVEGVPLRLVSDRAEDTVDPVVIDSDANGEAVFEVTTMAIGQAMLTLEVDGWALDDNPSVVVDFVGPQLELDVGEVELTYPGGRIALTASVSDADGPVEGVPLRLVSDRAEDTVDTPLIDSDANGEAVFEVTTMESGQAMLTLEVDGWSLDDNPSVVVDFVGPTLSGTWSFPQPGAVLIEPRIGAIYVHMENPMGEQVYRELVSTPLGETPELGSSGIFELTLPMHAPELDLYRPDPGDPDVPESFMIAIYGVGIYDDLDASGDFSDGDVVVSLSDEGLLLTYAEGELPDPAYLPGVVHGYQYIDLPEGGLPDITPFDDLIDQHDLDIRMAPCPSGPLFGQVTFGSFLPADSDTRVAVMMIDPQVIGSGFEEVFNAGNFHEMVSAPVAYAQNSIVDYELVLPEPSSVFPGYQDMLVEIDPQMPAFGILFPMVYVDSDENGVFTNDDNDLNTGDMVAGFLDLPFGFDHALLQWVDGQFSLFMVFMLPGINEGYNLVREPLSAGVDVVLDDNCLQVNEDLEPDYTDLPFRIEREEYGETVVMMEGDDLDTGAGQLNRVCSASGGFSGVVQVGDELVITNQIEEGEVLDLDTPIDLKTL